MNIQNTQSQNTQPDTVTLPRELVEQAANALFECHRFANLAETVALTIKQLDGNGEGDWLIGRQADLILDFHESMAAAPDSTAYDLFDALEK